MAQTIFDALAVMSKVEALVDKMIQKPPSNTRFLHSLAFLNPETKTTVSFSAGSMSSIENQSAIQSILESQTVTETTQQDCEDLFQCGKCKKQFTAVESFMLHKRGCSVAPQRPTYQQVQNLNNNNNMSSAFTATVPHVIHRPQVTQQTLQNYATVPQSPLNQLTSSMVLTDDQMLTFGGMDQTVQQGLLQTSTLHLTGTAVQAAGPFLSQVTQLTPRASDNVTILSPVQSTPSLAPSNGSAFTSTVSVNNLEPLSQAPQQITMATIPEKPHPVQTVIKPSPTKAGRKSAQANLLTVMEDHNMAINKKRSRNYVPQASKEDTSTKKKVCPFCGKSFNKNFDLQQHVRAHTGEKPYQCIVCGRAFAQKSNVKKHMASHKVWPSGIGVTLPSQPPALLVPTENKQEEKGNATAGTIEPSHLTSEDGLLHDGQVITVWTNPDGSEGQMSSSSASLSSHGGVTVLTQSEDGSAIVSDTQTVTASQVTSVHSFPDSSEYIEDKGDKSDGQDGANYKLKVVIDNSYLCQYCSEKFKSYFQLKSHMVKHKSEQVYKCIVQKCAATFKDLDAFLEHTTSHQDEINYRCHHCNRSFATLYELSNHQYTHSLYPQQGPKPGPRHFQCTKCMNKYSTPEALEHHMTTTDHKFPCPHCDKVFLCERYLRRHLPSHGTEGQFQCAVCDKNFKTEYYLRMHSLIHSGEKPYQCEECGAAFNRKDKLKRHGVIHDKRVKYRCPFKGLTGCSKEFNRPDKLKTHIISHSGIKPYSCKECGKEFSRKPHLNEHERGHRAEYRYNCDKCGRGFFRPKLFKEHKCVPRKDGQARSVFRPRPNKRKPGRPKKRMITVTQETVKADESKKRRGRRAVSVKQETKVNTSVAVFEGGPDTACLPPPEEASQAIIDDGAAIYTTHLTDTQVLEGPAVEVTTVVEDQLDIPKQKKSKTECFVKTNPPVSMVEHFVTVHLSNAAQASGNSIQTHLVPTGAPTHVQISPSSNSAFPPITIYESQPVHITVTHSDQLGVLGDSLTSIPVDIVTVSEEHALIGSQEVVDSDGNGSQSYVTCEAGMEDYNTGDNDSVLQGTENLINASAELLQSAQQVSEISLENV